MKEEINIEDLLKDTQTIQDDNFWVTALLLLMLLSPNFKNEEKEKQPIINIYLGGE